MDASGSAFDAGYFASNYGDYDRRNPPRKVAAYANWVCRHLPRGKVLEIGCAYGRYAEALATRFDVTAVDVSTHAIAIATARGQGPNPRFLCGDPLALTYPEAPFDALIAFDVLEHLPELDEVMSTLLRHLGPDGWVFMTVPVYDGPLGPLVRLLDRDPTHIHKWSRQAWLSWAERQGLTVKARIGLFRYGLGRHYLFAGSAAIFRWSPALFLALQRRTCP